MSQHAVSQQPVSQQPVSESQIFRAAVKLSADDRARYLDDACHGDQRLRAEVESLLLAHDPNRSFLYPPAAAITLDRTTPVQVGTLIGPYKLLEQIGEGGMGLVYMAEQQQPVRRLVALKLVKPGMDSKQVIARFEAERQALAMMDHPNIAKVYDAGTTEMGRPYFVMELVRGIPLHEFCDQKRLAVRERLQLFIQVCQAVQHAHQRGIIHRDLKPTNVLVAMADTVAFPKLLDFGIAKALGQSLTDGTLHTGYSQLVGTPLYMSPEQAEMNVFGVDTRSDVYSLGVLLYELLTGTTPFDKERLKNSTFDEMRRIIREEEPETVSARIARTKSSPGHPHRGSAPRDVPRGLLSRSERATELDWIVMKALEKDRTRRYESASALAADIQRYLSDEPVLACPPTTMYRFQKFARKHQPALVTAAAVALCLLLGTTVSAWQAVRATTAEAQANANEKKAVANAVAAEQKEQEAIKQRDQVKELNERLLATQQELQRTLYLSNMNLAQHTLETPGGAERASELLELHRPKPGETDLRCFEWYYLYCLCHAEVLAIKNAGGELTYSSDGKRLLSLNAGKAWDARTGRELFDLKGPVVMSWDKKRLASRSTGEPVELKVWDAVTGQELHALKVPGNRAVGRMALSPDGKRLAASTSVGGNERKMTVWDVETGQELPTLKMRLNNGGSVAFSPDGKRLVFGTGQGDQAGEVKMWDAETGQELFAYKGGSALEGVTISPDSQRLASKDRKQVKVWDAVTGKGLFTLQGHRDDIISVSFSPDSKRIASGGDADTTVRVWDAQTGKQLLNLEGHIGWVDKVVFSPEGKRLASRDRWGLKVWDVQTGEKLRSIDDIGFATGYSFGLAFSPDGLRLACTYKDGIVKVWDLENGQNPRTFEETQPILAVSPDSKILATAALNRTTKLLKAETGEELLTLKGSSGSVNAITFSPDGKRVATGSSTGPANSPAEVKVWDTQTGQAVFTLKGHSAAVRGVAFSPDGKRLASGSTSRRSDGRGEVKLWDAQSGQELFTLKSLSNCVAFSPDGKRLASGNGYPGWRNMLDEGSQPNITILDSETGREVLSLKGHTGGIYKVAYSPDGKRLASASLDGTAKVWNTESGQELVTFKGHSVYVYSVAFSPDGKRVASGSTDQVVKIWDSYTGRELLTLKGHTGGVDTLAFSPNGHWLASAAANTVKIWDATPLPEKP